MACEELYQRNYVYNKVNQVWYKRESVSNSMQVVCKEMFLVNKWSFVSCNETISQNDLLSINEVNECMKRLSFCVCWSKQRSFQLIQVNMCSGNHRLLARYSKIDCYYDLYELRSRGNTL